MSGGNDSRALGRWGEQLAAEYLEKKGYQILRRNFSGRFGEIDIIACDRQFLVFVEVKLRKNARFALALESVTPGKQRKIIGTAQQWLCFHPTELQPRFDVVEVYASEGTVHAIHHLENAF